MSLHRGGPLQEGEKKDSLCSSRDSTIALLLPLPANPTIVIKKNEEGLLKTYWISICFSEREVGTSLAGHRLAKLHKLRSLPNSVANWVIEESLGEFRCSCGKRPDSPQKEESEGRELAGTHTVERGRQATECC